VVAKVLAKYDLNFGNIRFRVEADDWRSVPLREPNPLI
jgi:hypothetical protein